MNYYNSIANIKIAPNHSAPLIYILQLKYGKLMTLFSSAYIVHHAIVIVIVRYMLYWLRVSISERQDQGWAVFKKASV